MEIDEIIDILLYGSKKEIEELLRKEKIKYSFSKSGEYSIENLSKKEGVRGHGVKDANCIKFFGENYN